MFRFFKNKLRFTVIKSVCVTWQCLLIMCHSLVFIIILLGVSLVFLCHPGNEGCQALLEMKIHYYYAVKYVLCIVINDDVFSF